jgi:hypothetical protein
MRWLLVVAATVALAAVAVPATTGATTPSVYCGGSTSTVLFWPHGHSAIKKVGFPKIKTPHLEVYRTAAGYPSANFQLYVDVKGVVDPLAACGSGPQVKVAAIVNAKTIKAKKAVVCNGSSVLIFDIKKSKKAVTVIGRTAANEVWRVVLKKTGASTLTYDAKLCGVKSSPG